MLVALPAEVASPRSSNVFDTIILSLPNSFGRMMAPRGRPSRRSLYERLDAAIAQLNEDYGGLPSEEQAADIWSDLWHRDTHHSTAIEGNTLALEDVEQLLERGRTTHAKPMVEYLEVRGYADAAKWVYSQARRGGAGQADRPLLTLQEVRNVHYQTMRLVWEVEPHPHASEQEGPGDFRRHQIARFPGGMKPPSWTEVDSQMRTWVDEACGMDELPGGHVMERFAYLHHRFEQVHPFIDGNGRTGRLLLNLLLARRGFTPIVIEKRHRDRYLDCLQAADAGNLSRLAEMLVRQVLDSIERFALPALAAREQLVPLASLTTDAVNEPSLRAAAIRGRLRAAKNEAGRWLSSRAAVEEYLAKRYQR
ncbi:Fic family protein [Glycomyces sp. L485]|uniref:Fic family protein n=1 Tax=Glycomyces sp. L485 TaxID=2909235 RepID=UPI001F4B9B35|nr:Fic family protein [Glycomyces sp. L485]